MNGRQEIESRREQIAEICRQHRVARLLVFGSVLRDDFDPQRSDIDFLVRFLPSGNKGWMWEYTELKEAMEKLFGRKVDVISESALTNPYLILSIDHDKELLYAA
jgi:predicted nucleotidyltransferase